jgi:FkbM family methyltransferase
MLIQTANLRGHTFLNRLNANSIVLDCGANHGEFARLVRERYGCRVIALEPNPALFATLPKLEGVTWLPYALGGQDGVMELQIGQNVEASSLVASPEGHHTTVPVQVRTLATVMKETALDEIDLVKLDIEGAEIPLLAGTPDDVIQKVGQFTIEFHDFNNYVTVEQVRAALARMRKLGFLDCRMTRRDYGDVFLVNWKRLGVSAPTRWWVLGVEKYLFGVRRIVARKFRGQPAAQMST